MRKIFTLLIISTLFCAACAKKAAVAGDSGVPTLVWWLVGAQPTDLNEVVKRLSDYSQEKIGVRFEIKIAGWSGAPARFQTIVNSSESFDIMYVDGTMYNTFVTLGAFADITDMLSTEAPGLLEVIPDVLWDGVRIKGKIYSVPSYKDSSKTVYQIWDESIVNKYNIDISKTSFAELNGAFHKIKAGEGKNFYPFSMAKGTNNFIFDNYDTLSSSLEMIGVDMDDTALRVQCLLEAPDVQEKYAYLRIWYKDGIINPDANLIDESPKRKSFMMAQGWPSAAAGWAIGEGVDKYIVSKYIGPLYTTDSIQGAMNCVSINSKHKEAALKFLELINTDRKFRDMLAYGIEGWHFEYVSPAIIRKLNDDWLMAAFEQGQFFNMSTREEMGSDWAEVLELNKTARVSPLLGFAFDLTPVRAEAANVKTLWNKYKVSLMTGAADPAVEIPRCMTELRKNGFDKIIAEAQRQVDEFTRSN